MSEIEKLEAIRRSLNLLCIIALFVVCYFARDLLFPIILGALVALTLSPVTRSLARIGVPYVVSAITLVVALGAAIVLLVFFSTGIVTTWAGEFRVASYELRDDLRGLLDHVETMREASDEMAEVTAGGADDTQEVVVKEPGLLDSAMSLLGQISATLLVTLVLATFLLASGDMFYLKIVQSFRTMNEKKRALGMVYDIERRVSRYLLTITLINAGLGVSIGLAMWAIGLGYPYIWGVLGFVLNFLPYLGAVAGVILVGLYALVAFDSFSYAVIAPLIYFTLTTIEGNFITPWLVGRRLELNSVAVFVTVVIWAWLWGIPGALVAVPVLVVFKVVCENVDRLQVVSHFLGSADTPDPPSADTAKPAPAE